MMDNCIFCKIIKGEIPSKKVYEDENVYAFHDINPNAPVHVLVIPKTHIPSISAVDESNIDAISKVMLAIPKIAGLSRTRERLQGNIQLRGRRRTDRPSYPFSHTRRQKAVGQAKLNLGVKINASLNDH
jgi:histidine triad (HIT) family protein